MDLSSLSNLSREELIGKARVLGVERPELMTRVELADEIVRRGASDPLQQRRARGWLGIARDLVASVVESGLNLPDAAAVIRGERGEIELKAPSPVATVTLAEIYATQGHTERALSMLDEVLAAEPEHEAAQALRERLQSRSRRASLEAPHAIAEPALDHAEPALVLQPAAAPALARELDPEPEPEYAPRPEPSLIPEPEPDYAAGPEPSVIPEPEPEYAPQPEPAALLESEAPLGGPAAPTLASDDPPDVQSEAAARPVSEPPIVLVLRAPVELRVCWEIQEPLWLSGPLSLLCIGFVLRGERLEQERVLVPVRAPRGAETLRAFGDRAVLRVALGRESGDGFAPLAIASELAPRGHEWTALHRPPLNEGSPLTAREQALAAEFAGSLLTQQNSPIPQT